MINLQSLLLGKEIQYCVILPENYDESPRRFPVLYLLHGLFGRFDNWLTNTKIIGDSREFPFLIVCPEGGDSWYANSENLSRHFYESYIFDELIPDVERRFKVETDRRSRAVAGLSMGGYGAFKFAFRQPEKFCFAASMSGAFHAAEIFAGGENEIRRELQQSISAVFGGRAEKNRAANNLFALAENFPRERIAELPYFYFDCGAEDSFLPVNQRLREIFRRRNIPHEFKALPGAHDWNYWSENLKSILESAAAKFSS